MKPYTLSIEIDAPRDEVVRLYMDPEARYLWQEGLQAREQIEGVCGEPGALAKLTFEYGDNRFDLYETIESNELPDRFQGVYEWEGGRNTLDDRFQELSPNRTRWETTCHYTFKSWMLKLMGLLTPGIFRKQNLTFMQNLKALAEGNSPNNVG